MTEIPEYERGYRDGQRWAVTWLHKRAKAMKDEKAVEILNVAAFTMGGEASRTRPSRKKTWRVISAPTEKAGA